jgi:hypothetical protein
MEQVTYGRDLLSQEGTRLSEAVGKLMIKDMIAKGVNMEAFAGKFKEAFSPVSGYMTFKEDVDTANSGALFITGLAQVIRAAVEPNMIGLELLQLNTDLMNGGGKGAIKLPKEKRVTEIGRAHV